MSGDHASSGSTRFTKFSKLVTTSEDLLLTLSLGAIILLPLIEAVLRKTLHIGISGASAITQHLCLIIAMLGGAVAARQRRLLSLGAPQSLLKGKAQSFGIMISSSCAATVALYLAIAGCQFVSFERESGAILAYGIPIWFVQLVLPLGFAVITLRLLWNSSDNYRGRVICAVMTSLFVGLCLHPPLEPDQLVIPFLCILVLAAALGAPVFTVIGGAALILFWGDEIPIASIPVDHYRLVTNATLPTIPLFTLAGYFLAEGGASKRLVRVFQSLVGRIRGGPAIITALVCAFFTSFTGASGVTILALGGLLMPVLIAAQYSEKDSLGLLTGAGSLGLLFPPCLPLILYAIIAKVRIEEMFLGGMLPGILLVFLTAAWGVWKGPKPTSADRRFDAREAWKSILEAKWELLLPVVAIVGLFSGIATPVEAAALTAFYAFFIETFVYHDLKIMKDIPRVTTECGLLVGGVLLILGVALGFTNYLVDAELPLRIVDWATESIESPYMFLLLLNIFLLGVGCLMDIYSAIVVVVPLIVPIGAAFGINPIHLGIIFLVNLQLGYITPPVGMNLFLSAYRFEKPIGQVIRAVLPMFFVLIIGVLLITYIPALTTTLPELLVDQ